MKKRITMGISGAAGNLSEESKKALQSETWQAVREGMKEKREVRHFTTELIAGTDNSYGASWAAVVNEYLKAGFMGDGARCDVEAFGITYKVLRRDKVTVFYNADGDTLFDVENERLIQEYGFLAETGKLPEESVTPAEAAPDTECNEDFPETESTDQAAEGKEDIAGQVPEDIPENALEPVEAAENEDVSTAEDVAREEKGEEPVQVPTTAEDIKDQAKKKLEKELEKAKNKAFAEPIIGYLLERCAEDKGLSADVVQEHKTWEKCFDYIFAKARKQATGSCAAVRDDVVYEWAEDYYHLDDKAEAGKKAKEAAERKKADKKNPKQAAKKEDKTEEKIAEPTKPKKNPKEVDGQMDLFSMMGV